MESFRQFRKSAPSCLCLHERPCPEECAYKYFARGKGCTLGVLFEDSVNIYFEWLTEEGEPVDYPAEIRYKFWPKREFTRLLRMGVWEVTGSEFGVPSSEF